MPFIQEAISSGKVTGDGPFTRKCELFFEKRYGWGKTLLTSSGTDALEMAAILTDPGPGDEVIVPSYTFVSSANAFALRGATIVLADSEESTPNMDMAHVRQLITSRTRVIVVMHYGGIACDMDKIMELATAHDLWVVEDAALALDGYYKDKPLGSFGHVAAFSFHGTKNIQCGEGGMLVINDPKLIARAEVIREKGTNRKDLLRGLSSFYEWVDIGSSYLPSEVTAAFLWAQLLEFDRIQEMRVRLWNKYREELAGTDDLALPELADYARHNGSIFFVKLIRKSGDITAKKKSLAAKGVLVEKHYYPLHLSKFGSQNCRLYGVYANVDEWSNSLLRLPLFVELAENEHNKIIMALKEGL